jgi:uncharacterized protein (TIGR03382 family)
MSRLWALLVALCAAATVLSAPLFLAVFGWMFRRRGLEGAMVAHAAADVWLQAALPELLA